MKKKAIIKKLIKFFPIILILLAITSFASYAYYQISLKGLKEHILNQNKFNFTYEETNNEILLEQVSPLTDEDGKKQNNYFDFKTSTILNTNDILNYNIILSKTKELNSFNDQDIKIYLTTITNAVEKEVVAPTLISDLKNYNNVENSKILYQNKFNFIDENIQQIHSYRLRIWLKNDYNINNYLKKEESGNEQIFKKEEYNYKFKVNVSLITDIIPPKCAFEGPYTTAELTTAMTIGGAGDYGFYKLSCTDESGQINDLNINKITVSDNSKIPTVVIDSASKITNGKAYILKTTLNNSYGTANLNLVENTIIDKFGNGNLAINSSNISFQTYYFHKGLFLEGMGGFCCNTDIGSVAGNSWANWSGTSFCFGSNQGNRWRSTGALNVTNISTLYICMSGTINAELHPSGWVHGTVNGCYAKNVAGINSTYLYFYAINGYGYIHNIYGR